MPHPTVAHMIMRFLEFDKLHTSESKSLVVHIWKERAKSVISPVVDVVEAIAPSPVLGRSTNFDVCEYQL